MKEIGQKATNMDSGDTNTPAEVFMKEVGQKAKSTGTGHKTTPEVATKEIGQKAKDMGTGHKTTPEVSTKEIGQKGNGTEEERLHGPQMVRCMKANGSMMNLKEKEL